MTDLLRRNLAPMPDQAWREIDEQAKEILQANLTARAVMGLSGPHGWELGAVNLGSLEIGQEELVKGVDWGVRNNLPLTELRVPFSVDMFEMDNIARGSKTPDLDAVVEAAKKAALFEENAVYNGFAPAGTAGVLQAASLDPVALPQNPKDYMKAIEDGIHAIRDRGIGGPYELILGEEPFRKISAGDNKGYPLSRRARELLRGGIHWSRALTGGIILSARGGDFEFTCGQDFSIGYSGVSGNQINLYIAESFAFRVLEPEAAIGLSA